VPDQTQSAVNRGRVKGACGVAGAIGYAAIDRRPLRIATRPVAGHLLELAY